jgi:hypothetical protein
MSVCGLVLGLAACSDPLAGVARLDEVDVVAATSAAALPDAEEIAREGFLSTPAATGDVPAQAIATPVPEGGFFRGLLRRAANADPADAIAADVATALSRGAAIAAADPAALEAVQDAPVQLAALAPDAAPRRGGFGLFGGRAPQTDAPRNGPDARDVEYGTMVPFGEIVRVCGAKGKSLGQQIDSLGRRGFALHDSNAATQDKRTFYITGFGDDCPRQFTAANALFGAPSFYEMIRFSPAGEHLPYADTDKAYDDVKSSVCRVGKKKPCGNKIDALDSALAFVSAYEFHEHNDSWKEFLVYDGAVLAGAVKSN